MRIGELARKSGVGVETVRFYERQGLVAQPRRPATGGYRDYPADAAIRIRFIRRAQQLGFSLNEIADLLNLQADDTTQCADVRARARTKHHEVQAKIEDLETIRDALDTLIDACPGVGPVRTCSILRAISSGGFHLTPIPKGVKNERHHSKD